VPSKIAILDFGGQYTQLIARRIRELGVYSEILPCTEPVDRVLGGGYAGIVLSGGPSSVYEDEAPLPDKRLLESGLPQLGICYGMQAMGFLRAGTWCRPSGASTARPSSRCWGAKGSSATCSPRPTAASPSG
jgi:GMP synthase (glutamine-hydrolysing)